MATYNATQCWNDGNQQLALLTNMCASEVTSLKSQDRGTNLTSEVSLVGITRGLTMECSCSCCNGICCAANGVDSANAVAAADDVFLLVFQTAPDTVPEGADSGSAAVADLGTAGGKGAGKGGCLCRGTYCGGSGLAHEDQRCIICQR